MLFQMIPSILLLMVSPKKSSTVQLKKQVAVVKPQFNDASTYVFIKVNSNISIATIPGRVKE